MNDDDPLNTLRCAQINFDNLCKANPAIAAHPFYRVARMQLDDAVDKLENPNEQES